MIPIAERKTKLRARTGALYNGRALMIEIDAQGVTIRESGRHSGYWVPWLAIYHLGAKIAARQQVKTGI